MKIKKIILCSLAVLLGIAVLLGGAVGIYFATYHATMVFDAGEKTGAVMKGASGYLYGIAENGVPSKEMVESLDITTISQKVPGGLQHPIGDMDDAAEMLDKTAYQVVYLQDVYDTWYYLHDEIMTARSEGTYDWQALLDNDYLPRVAQVTQELKDKPYADKLVYCLYNECDNGVWFGESQKDDNPDNAYGVWCDYNEQGRENFNQAWRQTYQLVKSIHPEALIGGPGFCDYNKDELEAFLSFCKDNDCLPDIMIYHELGVDTVRFFDEHIAEYRALEQALGMQKLPIIITEYGMMSENGYPGTMAQIITQFETEKVYGDNAYWRLADNLNDNCADDNSPNAQWWLMRWYTDMKGQTVKGINRDYLSSNMENYFKYDLDALSFGGFTGVASLSDNGEEIDVIAGGGNRRSKVVLKHLNQTALKGKNVQITVEETVYQGLYGIVSKPVLLQQYTVKAGNRISIDLGETDAANAYHIVAKVVDETQDDYQCQNRPQRFEFEEGTLLGNAYLYNSYAPASGGNNPDGNDLVGGMEQEGDGVELTFTVPEDGDYDLNIVYGKANDGATADERIAAEVNVTLDGDLVSVELDNTIRSEYTSCYQFGMYTLSKGTHKLKVEHGASGTYVLDSLVVSPKEENTALAILTDEDRTTQSVQSFLTVAPEDGYYRVKTAQSAETLTLDGTVIQLADNEACIYLKRGLNYLDVDGGAPQALTLTAATETAALTLDEPLLSGTAIIKDGVLQGITSESGAAAYRLTAETAGDYRVTLTYANNEEGGVHDYNVDLVEEYVTVNVNGEKVQNVFCRSTYSWDTFKTVTFTVSLQQGENILVFKNDGSHRFNNRAATAPRMQSVGVYPPQI